MMRYTKTQMAAKEQHGITLDVRLLGRTTKIVNNPGEVRLTALPLLGKFIQVVVDTQADFHAVTINPDMPETRAAAYFMLTIGRNFGWECGEIILTDNHNPKSIKNLLFSAEAELTHPQL